MQIVTQLSEQLVRIGLFLLVQGHELDILRSKSFIGERTFDGIQIVSSEAHKSPSSAQVVMKLVLEIDEAVVALLSEGHTSQDSTNTDFSNTFNLEVLARILQIS